MRTYLELLEREAPAVEFEEPILAARATGASAAELVELESAKLAALRVRALLAQRARREAELSALFETAGDLAGLSDLDAMLEAIVHRARQLLRADVSYMTLHDDERGDDYMRVANGSASAAFQQLRLPIGVGLGGLVAQTVTPYATSDYFADGRFSHADDIDGAVKEEGLVAILGVPMRLGGRAIGVLFAANRRLRRFPQEEVALLGSLAAHAAIAIDNARLLQETRAALAELSQANSVIRAHSEAVERAAQAHDRMASLVLHGGGVGDVAAMVTEVLGGAVTVLDSHNKPLSTVGSIGALGADVFEAQTASCATGRTVWTGDLSVATVEVDGDPLCTFVLRSGHELDDADQRILERAVLATSLLLLSQRSAADAEGRFRGELLDDMIAYSDGDLDALRERARRIGIDPSQRHVVVVARHDGRRERAAFWAASQATMDRGLAAARPREVVFLLPGDTPGAAAERIARELSQSLGSPATAGAAGPVTGIEQVAAAYRQAQRCADTLVTLGRTGSGASADALGFVGLLIGDDNDVSGFLASAIGAVVDYDARRRTELVQTLATYFGCGGSLAKTAQQLHIHVNTVTQRLERVASLIGADWQRPERALEIQLALRLHVLRELL